jgi:hypothetical protein
MDDDNISKHTVRVRYNTGDTSEQVFNSATDVDENEDDITFHDKNGKYHSFHGVSYDVVEE